MISIKKVNQHYGGTQILWDLDLDIEPGSRTCIMGRNLPKLALQQSLAMCHRAVKYFHY
jgi:ABC-type branched-subunit amino acid transport system ATPase component